MSNTSLSLQEIVLFSLAQVLSHRVFLARFLTRQFAQKSGHLKEVSDLQIRGSILKNAVQKYMRVVLFFLYFGFFPQGFSGKGFNEATSSASDISSIINEATVTELWTSKGECYKTSALPHRKDVGSKTPFLPYIYALLLLVQIH